jgi:hypothetical protein
MARESSQRFPSAATMRDEMAAWLASASPAPPGRGPAPTGPYNPAFAQSANTGPHQYPGLRQSLGHMISSPGGQPFGQTPHGHTPHGMTPHGQSGAQLGQSGAPFGQSGAPLGQSGAGFGQSAAGYGQNVAHVPGAVHPHAFGQSGGPLGQSGGPLGQSGGPLGQSGVPLGQSGGPMGQSSVALAVTPPQRSKGSLVAALVAGTLVFGGAIGAASWYAMKGSKGTPTPAASTSGSPSDSPTVPAVTAKPEDTAKPVETPKPEETAKPDETAKPEGTTSAAAPPVKPPTTAKPTGPKPPTRPPTAGNKPPPPASTGGRAITGAL